MKAKSSKLYSIENPLQKLKVRNEVRDMPVWSYQKGYEQGKKEAFLLRQKALGKPHLVFITYTHQSQIDIENHFDKPPSYLGWLQKEKKGYVFVPAYQQDYPTDYRVWTIGCLKELINKLEGLSKDGN
jgi:hypothetical protein